MTEITDDRLREIAARPCATEVGKFCYAESCRSCIARVALTAREEVARLTSLTTVMEDEITRYFERAQKAEARVAELEALIAHMASGRTPTFDATANPATRAVSESVAPSMAGCTCPITEAEAEHAHIYPTCPDCAGGGDE